jgi:hypothetical protein
MQKELTHITSEFTFIQIWFRNCFYTVLSNNHNLDFRDNQKANCFIYQYILYVIARYEPKCFQR